MKKFKFMFDVIKGGKIQGTVPIFVEAESEDKGIQLASEEMSKQCEEHGAKDDCRYEHRYTGSFKIMPDDFVIPVQATEPEQPKEPVTPVAASEQSNPSQNHQADTEPAQQEPPPGTGEPAQQEEQVVAE